MVEILNFPLPPSVNGLYADVYSHGLHRRVKSKVYKAYEQEVCHWRASATNQATVKALLDYIKNIGSRVLHVDAEFMMHKKSIICLNGKPKRNDTSNRLKALHDVLSSIVIGIDDSYFWSGSFSKEPIGNDDQEYVKLTFKLREISGAV